MQEHTTTGTWANIQVPICWQAAHSFSHQILPIFIKRGSAFCLRCTRICIPALPLTSCVVLDHLFSISRVQFPQVLHGGNAQQLPGKVMWGTQEFSGVPPITSHVLAAAHLQNRESWNILRVKWDNICTRTQRHAGHLDGTQMLFPFLLYFSLFVNMFWVAVHWIFKCNF